MDNKNNLYFDIWRKKDFSELIKVYTDLFHWNEEPQTSSVLRSRLKENLEVYFSDGNEDEEKKEITIKEWNSAYTLGLELGVFLKERDSRPAKYKLSSLGERLQKSQITSSHYLTIYLLNLNKLIANKIIHPLDVVLEFIDERTEKEITRDDIIEIPAFNLQNSGITLKNQRQHANVLLHRLVDSQLFEEVAARTDKGRKIKLSSNYSIAQIKHSINKFNGTTEDFLEMDAEGYVEMISTET